LILPEPEPDGGHVGAPVSVQPPVVNLPGHPEISVGRAAGWGLGYLIFSVLIGVGAGVLWEKIVRLPGYTVAADGTAATTERGLTEVFGSDAWFSVLGFVISIGLGIVAWKWFGRLGWPVVVVAVIGALCSAAVCWWVGYHLGPGPFAPRLAAARPGQFVPISLTLRSPSALIVWAFGAIIPVLLRSSLGRDEEEEFLPPAPRDAGRGDNPG
jgi:hypothetical protein